MLMHQQFLSIATLLRVFLLFSCVSTSVADLPSDLAALDFLVIVPGNPLYAGASAAFNRRFTFQPEAIFYPTSSNNVSAVMKLAAQYKFNVVARGGGHSYVANGLGGKNGSFVVDMSHFNTVSVNLDTHIATIGSGNRLGNVALALNKAGRAMPHGTCPYVGIGGHSGHGGYGFTSRQWGLTLDTIESLEVVLADGIVTTASSTQNQQLFWALRGASSSFGVVVTIKAKTFPAPRSATVFEYSWNLDATDAASALSEFQNFVHGSSLRKEFAGEIVLGSGFVRGNVSFNLTGGWYAPATEFATVIEPFLNKMPIPHVTKLTNGSYIDSVQYLGGLGRLNSTDIPDSTDTFYAKSLMTPPLSNTQGAAFMKYLSDQGFATNTNWFVEMELYGGTNSTINEVRSDATAFANRNSTFTIQFYTSAPCGLPPFPLAGFTLLDGMVDSIINNSSLGWNYGAYANYIDERLEDAQQLYFGSNYPQLRTLKKQFDPSNILRSTLSIQEPVLREREGDMLQTSIQVPLMFAN